MQGNHNNERNSFKMNSPQKGMWNWVLKEPGMQGKSIKENNYQIRLCTHFSYWYSHLTTFTFILRSSNASTKQRNWYTRHKKSSYLHHSPDVGKTLASLPLRRRCTSYFIGRSHVPTPIMFPVLVTMVMHKEEIQIIYLCLKSFVNQ